MIEKIGHIKNPLTVIAIFAAIAEISGTTVLPFIEKENQALYVWFLMLFPILLVGVFFLTLNFNHKVLYAPSDYQNEDNFVRPFGSATPEEKEEKLKEEIRETEEQNQQDEDKYSSERTKAEQMQEDQIRYSSLKTEVTTAEKLAIRMLTNDLNLKFRTNVSFEIPNNRRIVLDGFAIDKDKLHAVEVKLFKNKSFVLTASLRKFLFEAEAINSLLLNSNEKDVVFHIVAVVDNPNIDVKSLERKLSHEVENSNANFELHVLNLSELKDLYSDIE